MSLLPVRYAPKALVRARRLLELPARLADWSSLLGVAVAALTAAAVIAVIAVHAWK